ncbi:MAG TPA: phosphopantothenoylcysteine decarboxylase, partial [Conexibacter sp.]|nr:phosphopantothenoylcysteine decarboxylase [Conexibacter sp.]
HAATQANIAQLRARGVQVVDPGVGRLASKGEHGIGRLAEPTELLAACEAAIAERVGARPATGSAPADSADSAGPALGASLAGLRVLVTAGGTREPIDSVRYVGNRSSGRMGYALAEQAARRGAAVTVIAANVSLPPPVGATVVPVETAAQLADACADAFPTCDVLLMAAAVADFRPASPAATKLKKTAADAPDAIALEPTADVLSGLASARRPQQTIVGFAAEHGEGALAYAREKLARKRLDAIVVNDISRTDIGFDTVENEVTILTSSGEHPVARAPKAELAEAILEVVAALRAHVPSAH